MGDKDLVDMTGAGHAIKQPACGNDAHAFGRHQHHIEPFGDLGALQ
jgi:hypothetical protein